MHNKFGFEEALFECFCDSSGSPVLLTDERGCIQYINTDLLSKVENAFPLDKRVSWQPYHGAQGAHSTAACDDKLFVELKNAVINKELQLAAQPIFDLHNGELKIVEILLRWADNKYGEISPLKIIELASQNEYLFDIAAYVTENLIEFLRKNNHRYKNIFFSINPKSPIQA